MSIRSEFAFHRKIAVWGRKSWASRISFTIAANIPLWSSASVFGSVSGAKEWMWPSHASAIASFSGAVRFDDLEGG